MTAIAEIPLYILAVAVVFGAIDVNYFHMRKFKLYARPQSRAETMTHLFRGVSVFVLVLILANVEPRGLYFWAVVALVGVDFLNTVVDVLLEPRSRADLGGIPPLEYLLHIVGTTLAGAAAAILIYRGWGLGSLPTELSTETGLTPWVAVMGNVIAFGALFTALTELFMFTRAHWKSPSLRSTQAPA